MTPFRSIYLDAPIIPGRILDIFETKQSEQDIALFFVHGGGWTGGSRTIFHSIALAFREQGFEAASTDYRLGGVNLFEQVQDVRDALALFAADRKRRDRSTRFVLIGSSAGAHLALLAALRPHQESPSYQIAGVCVQAAPFTFEPWPDIFPAIWQGMQAAVGSSYEQRPDLYREASPIHNVTASTPPVFALHAENEHMFPLNQIEMFARKASECGTLVKLKTYARTEHGFFYSLDRWQQKEAFQDILHFIESLTPNENSSKEL